MEDDKKFFDVAKIHFAQLGNLERAVGKAMIKWMAEVPEEFEMGYWRISSDLAVSKCHEEVEPPTKWGKISYWLFWCYVHLEQAVMMTNAGVYLSKIEEKQHLSYVAYTKIPSERVRKWVTDILSSHR